MARTLIARASLLCAALALASAARSAGPADPFSPPRAARGAAAAASAAAGPTTAAVLTGVRTGARPAALIDGLWLPLGAQSGSARLVAVDADAAVLRHADGRVERLLLSPDVQLRRSPLPAAELSPRLARATPP